MDRNIEEYPTDPAYRFLISWRSSRSKAKAYEEICAALKKAELLYFIDAALS